MTKYRCIEKCTWLKQYWKFGDIYEGDATPPRFFEVYTGSDTYHNTGGSGSGSGGSTGINPVTYTCDCENKDFYFDVLKAPKVTLTSNDTTIDDDKAADAAAAAAVTTAKTTSKSKKTANTTDGE
ncbi:MAG: hypothetical protein IJ667_13460 [Synergistaceae bacterium]|nr:hypothetical protein [Synergistaceae bacterium]